MFLDNKLALDPDSGACDLAFDGTDLELDATPATPMMMALLNDRRARPDDVVPQGTSDFYNPASILARGGWVGDCLDASGQQIGSRLWLLQGGKLYARTLKLAASAASEALEIFQSRFGLVPGVKVAQLDNVTIAIVAVVAKTRITLNRVLA